METVSDVIKVFRTVIVFKDVHLRYLTQLLANLQKIRKNPVFLYVKIAPSFDYKI